MNRDELRKVNGCGVSWLVGRPHVYAIQYAERCADCADLLINAAVEASNDERVEANCEEGTHLFLKCAIVPGFTCDNCGLHVVEERPLSTGRECEQDCRTHHYLLDGTLPHPQPAPTECEPNPDRHCQESYTCRAHRPSGKCECQCPDCKPQPATEEGKA